MEQQTKRAVVRIQKGKGRTLKSGGAWIYENEIDKIEGVCKDGDLVTVEDFDGYFLGIGYINRCSTITVRIMSRIKGQEIDNDFLEQRVRDCICLLYTSDAADD